MVAVLSLLTAVASAGAVSIWIPSVSRARRRLLPQHHSGRRRLPRWVAPVGGALAVVMVVGSATGLVVAIVVAFIIDRGAQRSSARPERALAARRVLELPIAIEVLASCLAIGATQEQALRAVSNGLAGSLEEDFRRVSGALGVGADVAEAWSLVPEPDLRPLGVLLARAHTTGAAVAPQLWMLADQNRQLARVVAMDGARTLGVRSTGPLGLCFLPSFVLVAVVPLVLSLLPIGL